MRTTSVKILGDLEYERVLMTYFLPMDMLIKQSKSRTAISEDSEAHRNYMWACLQKLCQKYACPHTHIKMDNHMLTLQPLVLSDHNLVDNKATIKGTVNSETVQP
jgi:hypothetical protein